MQLRQYQKDILNKLWSELKAHNKILVSAPTGSGKTVMANALINKLVECGHRVAFVVDNEELVKQTYKTFGSSVSIVKSGYEQYFNADSPVQIIMIQTFYARKDKLPDFEVDYIIIDEVHVGWGSDRITQLLEIYNNAKVIGLSATPINGKGYLLEGFDTLVNEVQIADLIEQGYLAKPTTYTPANCILNLERVSKIGDDYNNKEIDKIVLDTSKVELIVDNWEQLAKDKKTLFFANSIRHAELIYHTLEKRGYDVVLIHSKIDKLDEARADMKNHQIVVNCAILTKGYDDPTLECIVLARPTAVLSLYLQIVGRALRVTETKKTALILDCANCVSKHGLAEDYRFYEKEPKKKNKCNYKECPECGYVVELNVQICPMCGYSFLANTVKVEKTKKAIQQLEKALNLQSILKDKIYEMVLEKGYKRGYAYYLFIDMLKNKKATESIIRFYRRKMNKIEKIKKRGYKLRSIVYD